mmetsp:Transcript_2984/g.7044  ORF Transcript_2984/g.7044 Transcript_2984/m.7044 type:complete len:256 (-) Transcript_2984:156-923(-)
MTDVPTTTTTASAAATTSSLPVSEDYTQLQDTPTTHESASPESPVSADPSSSTSTKRSRRSLKKSYSLSKKQRKIIVFASGSKYQWLVALLLVVPLAAIVLSIILFDVQNQEVYKNSSTIWGLSWCFIFLMVLYMAVLPRQVDVRSNGNVAVKTCLLTFHMDEIARATLGSTAASGWDVFWQRRVMLATSLDKDSAVVIRRHGGKWDVVVTPEDPEGFVNALEKMLLKKEENENNFVPVVTDTKAANLATAAQPV